MTCSNLRRIQNLDLFAGLLRRLVPRYQRFECLIHGCSGHPHFACVRNFNYQIQDLSDPESCHCRLVKKRHGLEERGPFFDLAVSVHGRL